MIGLDTNIIVRYFTQDHPAQTTVALELMDSLNSETPVFISLIVLVELIWVLERFYRTTKSEIVQSLETLLRSKELIVERADMRGKR